MLEIVTTRRFKRDLRRATRRGKDLDKIKKIITTLIKGKPLAKRLKDHPLAGEFEGSRECHIEPDWLLVYEIDDQADERRVGDAQGSERGV